ncbi:ribokinase [Sphingobacterium yanglingense]|uniref:Ribokinase n=1 Tax=Sphingobacterium yanglingense TaxID=1437280 RepID=A0A4R6WSU1_9SPHI|nr:ribokinase [Sphingobacterium yanglingense]TDQ79796.1 ribokinase [Sphingobacterium yanglingense]
MFIEKKIVVVGSTNTDMVVKTERFPNPGETVLGGEFLMNLGGKGANQAVAAARLGADVHFITRVGDDLFGQEAIKQLRNENIDVSGIGVDRGENSGVALITIDKNAENNIVVASGANAKLSFEDDTVLKKAINSETIVLVQLEIPQRSIEQVCHHAKEVGAVVVLNPAPASMLSDFILQTIDIVTPNQQEAEALSGIAVTDVDSAKRAAMKIHSLGPRVVIITMGAAGAFLYSAEESAFVDAYKVKAIDTTAAGDVFNGALVVGLSKGETPVRAMELASRAAAIAVTRIGAQQSAPTLSEVKSFFA